MHAAGKMFVKTYLKVIRDTFFPNIWNFPICDIFYPTEGESLNFFPVCEISQYTIFLSNRRGKFKLLGLQYYPSI